MRFNFVAYKNRVSKKQTKVHENARVYYKFGRTFGSYNLDPEWYYRKHNQYEESCKCLVISRVTQSSTIQKVLNLFEKNEVMLVQVVNYSSESVWKQDQNQ